MSFVWKMAVLAGTSAVACALACKISNKLFNKESVERKNGVNEVLVYDAKDDEARLEEYMKNLQSIQDLLCTATSSVNVCMGKLTSKILIDSLVKVAEKDVRVRIILHSDCSPEDMECMDVLIKAGCEHKTCAPDDKLDHEIILIDGRVSTKEPVALVGALNYTPEDFGDQYDNTLITSEKAIVDKLQEEFDRLWDATDNSS